MSTTTTHSDTTTSAAEHCGQCGAPAAHDQRYCLNCGFHRRNASDPVARYLGEASVALARVAAAEALARTRRHRMPRLGLRTVAVLVALALLAGVAIGNLTAGGSGSAGGSGAGGAAGRQPTTPTHTTAAQVKTGKSYIQQGQSLPDSVSP